MSKTLWLVITAVFIGLVVWVIMAPERPGKLDAFASCIKDSGATYYGAFWCPNCKNQEALFGRSAKLLPRIECSTPDGKGQLPVCTDAKVEGYPTWVFMDGTRTTGTQPLERLSELSGCPLPEAQ